MLLAGDLGGTKTLLGLYEADTPRPRAVLTREFATLDHDGLPAMIEAFLADASVSGRSIAAAVIGVAGPVRHGEAELTNVPWRVRAGELVARNHLPRVVLLNDVEAMAHSVDVLSPDEYVTLRKGTREEDGNAALLTVGTGVGQALLVRVNGRFTPIPSEGGHVDFAARTERDIALLRALRLRFGRVEVERVVSGPGLANIARVTHPGGCSLFPAGLAAADEPAHVTHNALGDRCHACREALEIYAEALGAVAGNLALTAVATGGLFVGGGVPPKILPALQAPRFLAAFDAKAPLQVLVERVPLVVITLDRAGLLGAAVRAAVLASAAGPERP